MNLLEGINPTTRIAGVALLTLPLLLSVDVVSATVALAFTLLAAPWCGMSYGQLMRRSWPIFLAAVLAGISMALYGRPEGREYASLWLAHITDNSLHLAAAIMVRVLAVALPVVIMAAHVDPTDLGDGLAQVWHLPARFVIGAVAAVRLLSLFQRDWASLGRARRARGIADVGTIPYALTMCFGLLVLALRRGSKLATAMEARGFDRAQTRTWARPSTVQRRDWVVLLVCAGVGFAAIMVSVVTGSFHFLGA